MAEKEEKKESAPKEPVLSIPLGNGEYPRVEVFVDSTGSSIGIRDTPEGNLRATKFGGVRPESFLAIVDKVVLIEKMSKGRKSDYDASFKDFLELYREHKEFMENVLEG